MPPRRFSAQIISIVDPHETDRQFLSLLVARFRICRSIMELLGVLQGTANRSVTYADWHYAHTGSPRMQTAPLINTTLIATIQNRTENLVGQYWDSTDERNHTLFRDCVYNGRSHSPCFLFARKFSGEKADVQALLQIPKSSIGF